MVDHSPRYRNPSNRCLPRVRISRHVTTPWSKVDEAMYKCDYSTALSLAKKILAQHPNEYYAHAYLGNIYFEIGDLDRAEAEYLRAEELSPPHYLQERLKEVRERRAARIAE